MQLTRRFFLGGSAYLVSVAGITGCAAKANDLLIVTEEGQFFTADEMTLLQDVAEIMIPRTTTPGANDAQVASFVDGLMLTWASDNTKKLYRETLASLDPQAKVLFGTQYRNLSLEKRAALIAHLDANAFSETPEDGAMGYKHLKYIIFHVYYTSEEAGQNYVPIPGGYYGNLTLADYNELMAERSYGG